MLRKIVERLSKNARRGRADVFRSAMDLKEGMRILDLGSEDGRAIDSVLKGTDIHSSDVYIADIREDLVMEGSRRFGFRPVVIPESGRLPFDDKFFDVVYCSSVIEHVTLPKSEIWQVKSGREFRSRSLCRQGEFAEELTRVGKQFFAQTPNRHFLIESHSWLPMLAFIPRRLQLMILRLSNRYWIKKTDPDWNLLSTKDVSRLFPGARIVVERFLGMPKSIIAIGCGSSDPKTPR